MKTTKGEVIRGFREGNKFLSNLYNCSVVYQGIWYHSSENAYQSGKTDNAQIKGEIALMTPVRAKRRGKEILDSKEAVYGWMTIRKRVMLEVLRAKFTQNLDLKMMLLGTGQAELCEGNEWGDTFWGMDGRVGENWLGRLLMHIRDEIRLLEP